ncbi:MAG: TrkA C-terminal domain-containing protein [Firmicutes bacterium]|nr:TrkA C-terminal domain-containing protein [Bacillota bacterium]
MNIYAAFSLFTVVILLYWIISELFTILFRFTGLPSERARFQVISLLTGTGFTTRESEMVLSSKSRRRLARVTMLFGYVFYITIVSAFINVFLSMKLNQVRNYFLGGLIPFGTLVLIVLLIRVPAVRSWADALLERLAGRLVNRRAANTVMLMDYIGKDSIAAVRLYKVPEELRDVKLMDSGLKQDHGILVMIVERPGQKAEAASADTVFQDNDKITVFGNYKKICQIFNAKELFEDED